MEQIVDPVARQAWETMVRTYGQTPAQLFRAAHPLPMQNLSNVAHSSQIPQVIEGITGNYYLSEAYAYILIVE